MVFSIKRYNNKSMHKTYLSLFLRTCLQWIFGFLFFFFFFFDIDLAMNSLITFGCVLIQKKCWREQKPFFCTLHCVLFYWKKPSAVQCTMSNSCIFQSDVHFHHMNIHLHCVCQKHSQFSFFLFFCSRWPLWCTFYILLHSSISV